MIDLATWLRAAGLPQPQHAQRTPAGWGLDFGSDHPAIEILPAVPEHPVSAVADPLRALTALHLAREAGIPAARDARILQVDGQVAFARTWLRGPTGLDVLRSGDPGSVCREAGRRLAQLRALNGPAGDIPTGSDFVGGLSRHHRVTRAAVLAFARGWDAGEQTDALIARCRAAGPAVDPCLVHGRFGPAALRFEEGRGFLTDWASAYRGDPFDDFAEVALLDPGPRRAVVDAAGGWPRGPRAAARLTASLAMAALTRPDPTLRHALARLALVDHGAEAILAHQPLPFRVQRPEAVLRHALLDRLARLPIPTAAGLVTWLGAAACLGLSLEGVPGDWLRLGEDLLSSSPGFPARHVGPLLDPAPHPARRLVDLVLPAQLVPRGARIGAAGLTRVPADRSHEGIRAMFDLLEGSEASLGRVAKLAGQLGAARPHTSAAPLLEHLAAAGTLQPHQHAIPVMAWSMHTLGQRIAPVDPLALVFGLFGAL